MKVKAIIFDLGGVLFTNGTKLFIKALSKRYKLNENYLKEGLGGKIGSDYRESKITRYEFWEKVIKKLDFKENADDLETEWISYYDIIPKTKKFILDLRKRYKVYYLSDNVKERVDKLDEKFGFLKWFDGEIFSHEVGVRKPKKQIYKLMQGKIACKSNEIIFIDDKQKCLKPAKALGWKTILFNSNNPHASILEIEKLFNKDF